MKKVLLVTNIPTPYRIPLFNKLHERLKQDGISLKIVFAAMGYERRKWEIDASDFHFDYHVLGCSNLHRSDHEKSSFGYQGLWRVIRREQPSLIVSSGFSVATSKVWLMSFFTRTSFIIWSGATKGANEEKSMLRTIHRRLLTAGAAGYVAYGSKAKDFLEDMGAKPEKIEVAINTVDTTFFMKACQDLPPQNSSRNNCKRLLYVGHLVARKRLDNLLKVIATLALHRTDFLLQIVGDGPERENLCRLSEKLGIEKLVTFEGFKQKSDLPCYLAGADCFLFPTGYDIWGLVLVEAMAAGVPCVSSIHAGAAWDLVQDGETGFAVDFSVTESAVKKILWLLENPGLAKAMGLKGQRFICEHATIEESVEGFQRAVSKALGTNATRAANFGGLLKGRLLG